MSLYSSRVRPSPVRPGFSHTQKARASRSFSCICLLVIVAALALVPPVSGYTTLDSITAAGRVYVSNVTIDPGILFTGDKATVTFAVTNGNTNSTTSSTDGTTTYGVMFNHATFGDNDIHLVSGTYDSSSNVGPLQTRTYVFDVVTNATEGTYYPTFSLDFRDASSLYYRTPVKVDNTPIMMTVISQPDAFTEGKKELITVQIANPRQNAVKNVVLKVTGTGATLAPSEQYIGWLSPNSATNVTFSVTPNEETVLDLALNYDNGDNHHAVTGTLPIAFTADKTRATPLVSNIEVKLTDGVYHVTGDVTNAGLTNANGVTVTALSPAEPRDPYRQYVIGALKPDDFGSFEVTFSAPNNTASVPVQVSYKDADGNIVRTVQNVSLPVSLGPGRQAANTSSSIIPLAAGVIVLAIFVSGWVFYLRKHKE